MDKYTLILKCAQISHMRTVLHKPSKQLKEKVVLSLHRHKTDNRQPIICVSDHANILLRPVNESHGRSPVLVLVLAQYQHYGYTLLEVSKSTNQQKIMIRNGVGFDTPLLPSQLCQHEA